MVRELRVDPCQTEHLAALLSDTVGFPAGPLPPPFTLTLATWGLVRELTDLVVPEPLRMRYLHMAQSIVVDRTPPTGKPLLATAWLGEVRQRGMASVVMLQVAANDDADSVGRLSTTLLVRGAVPAATLRRPGLMPDASYSFSHQGATELLVPVPADFPRRYADASGDEHPLHCDVLAARAAGFAGPLLHGLATAAVCVAVATRLTALDAGDMCRLDVWFRSPVVPPVDLRVAVSQPLVAGPLRSHALEAWAGSTRPALEGHLGFAGLAAGRGPP
jgi:hypothetical protein